MPFIPSPWFTHTLQAPLPMKKYLILFVLLAVAGLALAPALDATSANVGGLVGVVVDTSGARVPGAAVNLEVTLPSGRVFTASTHTDRHGRFEFMRVPAGPGVVRAHKRGVGQGGLRGRIIAGQVVRARIVLR